MTPSDGNRKAAMLALLHNAALDEAYMPLLASLGVCAIASRHAARRMQHELNKNAGLQAYRPVFACEWADALSACAPRHARVLRGHNAMFVANSRNARPPCRALQAMLCEAAPQGPAASGPCALRKRAGPLPPHADSIICHAAALLCAMSRNDACKVQLREGGAARLLLLARASRNLRTYESCTGAPAACLRPRTAAGGSAASGRIASDSTVARPWTRGTCGAPLTSVCRAAALWNIGLEPGSDEHLDALAAPPFLCAPVPASWQATDNDAYLLPRGLGAATATPAVGHHPTWDVSYHEAASAAA